MKKEFLFIIALFFSVAVFTQTITVSGIVTDVDGHPIANARYYFGNTPNSRIKTDAKGKYSVKFEIGKQDTLKFRHVGFNNFDLRITPRMVRKAKNSRINKDIILPDKVGIVIVVTSNVPDTVFGTQEYSVADFEFDNTGQVVLLTYQKTLKKGSVIRLLDTNQNVIDSYYVEGKAIELRTDFRGNVHLIAEERVYLVETKQNSIKLYLESRDYYFKYVAPLIDTIGSKLYFSNYSEIYPAFDYLEFDRKDSVYKKIMAVEDTSMMEQYRAEYKFVDVRTKLWAHNKQIETGIDKEIWVGASVFSNSIYYEPLYAPLFKVGEDSIFVFDHYKDLLFKYEPTLGFVDSTRITYHKKARKSGWEQPLIQDRKNDQIYTSFLRNGYTYLSEIDCSTGQIRKSFRLHFKYVEKIRIINGYVYYIYRPFESIQKKYIYREEL